MLDSIATDAYMALVDLKRFWLHCLAMVLLLAFVFMMTGYIDVMLDRYQSYSAALPQANPKEWTVFQADYADQMPFTLRSQKQPDSWALQDILKEQLALHTELYGTKEYGGSWAQCYAGERLYMVFTGVLATEYLEAGGSDRSETCPFQIFVHSAAEAGKERRFFGLSTTTEKATYSSAYIPHPLGLPVRMEDFDVVVISDLDELHARILEKNRTEELINVDILLQELTRNLVIHESANVDLPALLTRLNTSSLVWLRPWPGEAASWTYHEQLRSMEAVSLLALQLYALLLLGCGAFMLHLIRQNKRRYTIGHLVGIAKYHSLSQIFILLLYLLVSAFLLYRLGALLLPDYIRTDSTGRGLRLLVGAGFVAVPLLVGAGRLYSQRSYVDTR
ncbi:MAG: hypothetical protein QM270_01700 [Bacillota bacterium]|nr:hypothetical protein [Bacillota bacterium]